LDSETINTKLLFCFLSENVHTFISTYRSNVGFRNAVMQENNPGEPNQNNHQKNVKIRH